MKKKQATLFEMAECLPLFSGTAMKGEVEHFAPLPRPVQPAQLELAEKEEADDEEPGA
ncbi:MAG: hypothetical protein JXA21_06450 [Anaerolineae bacterium]|nr:hypothetical protein [Anaerolineae bacterium]